MSQWSTRLMLITAVVLGCVGSPTELASDGAPAEGEADVGGEAGEGNVDGLPAEPGAGTPGGEEPLPPPAGEQPGTEPPPVIGGEVPGTGTPPDPNGGSGTPTTPPPATSNPPTMSFFVTSRGMGRGGDLRATLNDADGLAGADAFCKQLATEVSAELGAKNWRAYLSTTGVNARDRIGSGPWHNAKGVLIAENLAQLHEENGQSNNISAANSLDERGNPVPGVMRPAGTANEHDILTGSLPDGRVAPNATCNNWTSGNGGQFNAQVGHHDRMGGNSASWNSVHATGGCGETGGASVRTGGGRGSLYCFAAN